MRKSTIAVSCIWLVVAAAALARYFATGCRDAWLLLWHPILALPAVGLIRRMPLAWWVAAIFSSLASAYGVWRLTIGLSSFAFDYPWTWDDWTVWVLYLSTVVLLALDRPSRWGKPPTSAAETVSELVSSSWLWLSARHLPFRACALTAPAAVVYFILTWSAHPSSDARFIASASAIRVAGPETLLLFKGTGLIVGIEAMTIMKKGKRDDLSNFNGPVMCVIMPPMGHSSVVLGVHVWRSAPILVMPGVFPWKTFGIPSEQRFQVKVVGTKSTKKFYAWVVHPNKWPVDVALHVVDMRNGKPRVIRTALLARGDFAKMEVSRRMPVLAFSQPSGFLGFSRAETRLELMGGDYQLEDQNVKAFPSRGILTVSSPSLKWQLQNQDSFCVWTNRIWTDIAHEFVPLITVQHADESDQLPSLSELQYSTLEPFALDEKPLVASRLDSLPGWATAVIEVALAPGACILAMLTLYGLFGDRGLRFASNGYQWWISRWSRTSASTRSGKGSVKGKKDR